MTPEIRKILYKRIAGIIEENSDSSSGEIAEMILQRIEKELPT